jgi:hypothetical protein
LKDKECQEDKDRPLSTLREKQSRAYYSYQIIEYLRNNPGKFNFYTSDLAIVEVTSVIFEKYVIDELVRDGISLKYFWKFREQIILPAEASKKIHNEIFSFRQNFIDKDRIRITNKISYYVCRYLICQYHVETHDSFLLSQANQAKCNLFISNDSRLKRIVKNYKKVKVKKSATFYHDLKQKQLVE